ncbi:hypothetical protein [Limosilactobacillus reuteri]|uniref:hypothetical protein n=1 Tax=Limosilactobacillus reuteri TaxID=1598 RepID=UPI002B05BEAE|nr:hypothetical protein [Limosilactobacillus reuteri]
MRIKYFAKKKGSSMPIKPIGWHTDKTSTPVKGLLQFKPSTFSPFVEFEVYNLKQPKTIKEARARLLGFRRPSGIKRTRKRQIARAKHMMDFHDHTSYEWSQWWSQPAHKPKRWSN